VGNLQIVERFVSLRRDVVRKVRQEGVLGMLKHAIVRGRRDVRKMLSGQLGDSFDATYNTDTARIVSVGALDIPDEKLAHSNRYEAVVPDDFFRILNQLPDVLDEYIFIDIGSGKGRALLLASKFPFKQIIGVEHSATLTEVATSNIKTFKDERQQCRAITAVCQDATAFAIPNTKVVLYLHNPFDQQPMRAMVGNTEESLRANPRRMFVVYHRPVHRATWDASHMFSVIVSTDGYVIYRSNCAVVADR
jgi:SAM-dependent methyltransferase